MAAGGLYSQVFLGNILVKIYQANISWILILHCKELSCFGMVLDLLTETEKMVREGCKKMSLLVEF